MRCLDASSVAGASSIGNSRRPARSRPGWSGRDGARTIAVLATAAAAVIAATLGIAAFVIPSWTEPTFDVAAGPAVVGGDLVITGDRAGVLQLDSSSRSLRYESVGDVRTVVQGDVWLRGPDGQLRIGARPGEDIGRIDYDGLSFYLDPDDCTVTPGAHNVATGLVSASVECPRISDIRGNGTITVDGVVALPADVLGIRGSLPSSGGSVQLGDSTLRIEDAVAAVGGVLGGSETPLISLVDRDGGSDVGVTYDPESSEFALITLRVAGDRTILRRTCPLDSETLGRLNPQTTVVRLTFDCQDVAMPGGGSGPVTGTVVVDVVEGSVTDGPGNG